MASSGTSPSKTLYIVYNASGTITGKLMYGYRKLTAPSKSTSESSTASGKSSVEPVCAACDITHGGLSLSETAEWIQAKKEIEDLSGMKVVQLHRNEVDEGLKTFVKNEDIRYPAVILEDNSAERTLKLVVNSRELADCDGDAPKFVQLLKQKDLIKQEQASL